MASQPDVITGINNLEQKLLQAKGLISDIIVMLQMHEDRVPYPELLDQYANLASTFSNIQEVLKKSAIPSGPEDGGSILKSSLLVPSLVSMDPDETLSRLSENRLQCWNHDVVPDYLRTKMGLTAEEEEAKLDIARPTDTVYKQIQALNKHLEAIVGGNNEIAKAHEKYKEAVAFDHADTKKLVKGIMRGEGLRNPRTSHSHSSSSGQLRP